MKRWKYDSRQLLYSLNNNFLFPQTLYRRKSRPKIRDLQATTYSLWCLHSGCLLFSNVTWQRDALFGLMDIFRCWSGPSHHTRPKLSNIINIIITIINAKGECNFKKMCCINNSHTINMIRKRTLKKTNKILKAVFRLNRIWSPMIPGDKYLEIAKNEGNRLQGGPIIESKAKG